ncbi:amidoligase family protein [Antarctobacter jejuensis]|uniref:amidoligase family protein n=1 Tax=Antarctobacter jejuensis TaxID=1439938 RepID=UPI003FD2CC1A
MELTTAFARSIAMEQTVSLRGFRALPVSQTRDGSDRRCGIEIEFAGLDEAATARHIAASLGGRAQERRSHLHVVEDTTIGTVCVELDTRYAKPGHEGVPEELLDAARPVVPVEIVTPPLTPEQMDKILPLMRQLQQAGAKGTSDSLLAGFGIHFNPEVPGFDHPHTLNCIVAYALIEPWIRAWRPLDFSRRVLPFVDPWPERFRDAVIMDDALSLKKVRQLSANHLKGRNYGLDLLPLLRADDEEAFVQTFDAEASGGRPAFHFRMPDCRVDEADWSLTVEWDRWWMVEKLATDQIRLEELRGLWETRGLGLNWVQKVSDVVGAQGEELLQ